MAENIDKIYKEYKEETNMTYNELLKWSKNPCSKKASLSRDPIKRNLRLLKKNKSEWTKKDVEDAKRTINFINRMRGSEAGDEIKGCGVSKKTISLKNWAYNPNK